jgi:chromosome partitioning protein
MLADGLACYYGMNVLVIDLDPQAKPSQILLTEMAVQGASDQGKGTHHLLASFMAGKPPSTAPFIMPNAITLEELRLAEKQDVRLGWTSSLPPYPHLRERELSLEEEWYGRAGMPTTLADAFAQHYRKAFEALQSLYDIILIDCPPHLSPLARAGLALADAFVTATIADPVSTWGRKQVFDWIGRFIAPDLASRNFVLITRFRYTKYARQVSSDLRDIYLKDRWSGPTLPESVHVLNTMDRAALDRYNSFRGKHAGVTGDVWRLSERCSDFITQKTGISWHKVRD